MGFLFFFIVPLEAFLENSNLAQIVLLPISKFIIILVRNPEGQAKEVSVKLKMNTGLKSQEATTLNYP